MSHGREEGAAPVAAPPRGPLGWPERMAGALSLAAATVGGAVILVILAVTAINVIARYVLSAPIQGADEATGFMVVAVVMLGTADALRRGDHIRIDLLTERAGPRLGRILDIWSDAGVTAFAVLLFATSWQTMTFSMDFEAYSTGYLALPLWIPQAALPLGAALLGLQAAARMLRRLGGC